MACTRYPTVTSHYGFHVVSWHIPLAMSGQLADLSQPTNRSLTFAPTIAAPYVIVVFPGNLRTVFSCPLPSSFSVYFFLRFVVFGEGGGAAVLRFAADTAAHD